MVSTTETSRLTRSIRGSGPNSSEVGSFVGSASVPPAPSGVSVVAGAPTAVPSGAVPVSEMSVTVTALPLSSSRGEPSEATALPSTVAELSR